MNKKNINLRSKVQRLIKKNNFDTMYENRVACDNEEYPYYLDIERVCVEDDDYMCHDNVNVIDKISDIRFSYEDDAQYVASILSESVREKYPEIPGVGVIVINDPRNDDEEECDEPWENSFYLNGYNVWDEDELEEYLENN